MNISEISSDLLRGRREYARSYMRGLHKTIVGLESELKKVRREFTVWNNIFAESDRELAEREKVTKVPTEASRKRAIYKVEDSISNLSGEQLDELLKALMLLQQQNKETSIPPCEECNNQGGEGEPCPSCGREKYDDAV